MMKVIYLDNNGKIIILEWMSVRGELFKKEKIGLSIMMNI
jgi:hypothetical protein